MASMSYIIGYMYNYNIPTDFTVVKRLLPVIIVHVLLDSPCNASAKVVT
jgi:hypothetical protein